MCGVYFASRSVDDLGVDIESDRHLHPLAGLQNLLFKAETVDLGKETTRFERGHVIAGLPAIGSSVGL